MSKGFDIWLRFRYMTPGALPKYRNIILHITFYHKLHLQKKKSFDIMSKGFDIMSKGFDIWLRFRYMTPGALPKYRNKFYI